MLLIEERLLCMSCEVDLPPTCHLPLRSSFILIIKIRNMYSLSALAIAVLATPALTTTYSFFADSFSDSTVYGLEFENTELSLTLILSLRATSPQQQAAIMRTSLHQAPRAHMKYLEPYTARAAPVKFFQ